MDNRKPVSVSKMKNPYSRKRIPMVARVTENPYGRGRRSHLATVCTDLECSTSWEDDVTKSLHLIDEMERHALSDEMTGASMVVMEHASGGGGEALAKLLSNPFAFDRVDTVVDNGNSIESGLNRCEGEHFSTSRAVGPDLTRIGQVPSGECTVWRVS